jgi:uncharacterized membrane protein YfcA
VSGLKLVAGSFVIALAALVGGATGFGTSLVGTPALLLLGLTPGEVVTTNLSTALITRLVVVFQLRAHMASRRVLLLVAGSVPGALLGVQALSVISIHLITLLAGACSLAAGIALALDKWPRRPPPATGAPLAAGFLGGLLGTTTSLNGLPPAVLLASDSTMPLTFIADLAGYFVVSNSLALVILALRHTLAISALTTALPVWAVAALAGNRAGLWIAPRVPPGRFRALALATIIASALVAMAKVFW